MDQAQRVAHSKRLLFRAPVESEQPKTQPSTGPISTTACRCGTRPGDKPGTPPVCPVCLRFAAAWVRYRVRVAGEAGGQ